MPYSLQQQVLPYSVSVMAVISPRSSSCNQKRVELPNSNLAQGKDKDKCEHPLEPI